jgi:hypothetical protein
MQTIDIETLYEKGYTTKPPVIVIVIYYLTLKTVNTPNQKKKFRTK